MKKIATLLAAVAITATAWAIPAKPGFRAVAQPDGSVVMLQLVGDEHHHHFVTTDGLAVVRDGDAYCYANVNAAGDVTPSATLAVDPEMRTDSHRAIVAAIDRDAVRQAFASHRTNARRAPQRERGIGLYDYADFPIEGEVKGIVILVQYTDVTFTISDEEAHEYFGNMLNEPGFSDRGGTGSARDYYLDASMGVFQPTFDLYGPVTLSHPRSYYGGNDSWGNDKNPEKMITEAIDILKQDVDFSQYDVNGDGVVDNIFVYYAGVGEAQSWVAESVWPHAWELSAVYGGRGYRIDTGLYANHYACSSELCDNTNLDGIGTFVHEFSHVMGLPDLYNTEDVTYVTPGEYDVMDQGSYNGNSRTPPTYSVFERAALGWLTPTPITENFAMELGNIADTNEGYIVTTGKTNEFFLFENRQREGWDKHIPYHGMLVWHIDYNKSVWYSNSVNNNDNHQRVDIVEACNRTYSTASGMRRYPFPGSSKVTTFNAETQPALVDWAGNNLGVSIDNIAETADGIITADVTVGTGGITAVTVDDSRILVDGRTVSSADGTRLTVTDLAGRRITVAPAATLAPGIYIVNGRKVAIK